MREVRGAGDHATWRVGGGNRSGGALLLEALGSH
jgi:hypothetical protein